MELHKPHPTQKTEAPYENCALESICIQNNNIIAVMDQSGGRVFVKKAANDPELVLEALAPYQEAVAGVAVESTFNWYWLVDLLMDAGYRVRLANPAAIYQYKGLKHSNDVRDAFWLAEMLRLGILPEGCIYPKETRPVRDILRTRRFLMGQRTALITSLQNVISRNRGVRLKGAEIKFFTRNKVSPLLKQNEDLALVGRVHRDAVLDLSRQIQGIEGAVEARMKSSPEYERLRTIPGVGKILGLTIMLETGSIVRFAKAGNYASYCRKVSGKMDQQRQGEGQGQPQKRQPVFKLGLFRGGRVRAPPPRRRPARCNNIARIFVARAAIRKGTG